MLKLPTEPTVAELRTQTEKGQFEKIKRFLPILLAEEAQKKGESDDACTVDELRTYVFDLLMAFSRIYGQPGEQWREIDAAYIGEAQNCSLIQDSYEEEGVKINRIALNMYDGRQGGYDLYLIMGFPEHGNNIKLSTGWPDGKESLALDYTEAIDISGVSLEGAARKILKAIENADGIALTFQTVFNNMRKRAEELSEKNRRGFAPLVSLDAAQPS